MPKENQSPQKIRSKNIFFIVSAIILIGIVNFFVNPLDLANTARNKSFSLGEVLPAGAPAYLSSTESLSRDSTIFKQVSSELDLENRSVIKNGFLSLLVKKAEEQAKEIAKIAENNNGFVENSNIYEVSDGIKNGSIAIRVPEDKFSAVMDEIKEIAVKVESEQINSTDVTDQLVDFDARLKNLIVSEERFLEILKKADTVEDILSVQKILNDVRGQIERLEAQLKNLSGRVSMSSISVSLTSEPDVQVFGIIWRPLYIAKQAVRDGLFDLRAYTDGLTRFIIRLPVLILKLATYFIGLFIVFLIGRKFYRWTRKKFFA